jgi:hydrogenase expression/formation protein HypC
MCLAIPGKILELLPDQPNGALVDVVGVRRKVDIGLLEADSPLPGDWILIHVGFGLSKISEKDALDQLRMLTVLGESEAASEEARGYGLEDLGKLATGGPP